LIDCGFVQSSNPLTSIVFIALQKKRTRMGVQTKSMQMRQNGNGKRRRRSERQQRRSDKRRSAICGRG
jgi:hypothetical protein